MSKLPLNLPQTVSIIFLLCVASGCASVSDQDQGGQPAMHQFSDYYKEGDVYPEHVYDPLEGFNRRVYRFNAAMDEFILLPAVNGYEAVTPEFVRTGISNFFNNIGEIITFANEILQFKLNAAGKTVLRFVANSTLGVFGFNDVTGYEGIPRTKEDFGQTLGYWGVGDGPYLILPFLGPSNLRDAAGYAIDTIGFTLADPLNLSSLEEDYPAILALSITNHRYTQPFRYYETGSPFEYELIRFLYTADRRADIEK